MRKGTESAEVGQAMPRKISHRAVERLSTYRRVLTDLTQQKVEHVYSHDLARAAGVTAAQVRRDLMVVRYSGNSVRGYHVASLAESIGSFLDGPGFQPVVLVGVGNLGRAILAYFAGRRPHLGIVAAFDKDPRHAQRVIGGCRCYPVEELPRFVAEREVRLGIVAVPAPEAQGVADLLVRSGVRGILNFAPAALHVPPGVFVERVDMTTLMEKVAFFARLEV